jgi:integrase
MARKRRGRGEGGVFQRSDGLWVGVVSLGFSGDGKRRRKTVYGRTKAEAQDKLRQAQTDAASGRPLDTDTLTLGEFLARWLDGTVRPRLNPTTVHRYEQLIRLHIIPHVGAVRVAKFAAAHVEQLYASMAAAGASADTRHKAGVLLGTALRRAARLRLLATNPVRDVDKPRPVRKEIRPLDADQAGQLVAAARPDRLYSLYALALDSGMRQGELFALQWEDIDWATGTVQVRHSLEEIKGRLRLKDVKTKHGRRRIKLAPSTLDALQEHRKTTLAAGRYRPDGPVFSDQDGGWLRKSNLVRRSFQPLLARAGLPAVRFHDLRHTTATLLLLANFNPKIVSERLGHSKIQVTLDTYSHLLPTMQDGAADRLEVLLHRPKPTSKGPTAASG